MKNFSTCLFALLAFASCAFAQVTLNTPSNPAQCIPTMVTWSGGSGPFFLTVNSPDANGPIVESFAGLQGNSFTWPTNITAGTFVGFTIRDSTGSQGQTAPIQIQSSPDSSCLVGGVGSTVTPSSSGGSTTAAGSTTASGSSSGVSGSTSGTSGVSSASVTGTTSTGSVTVAALTTNRPASTSAASSGSANRASSSGSGSSTASPSPTNNAASVAGVNTAGIVGAILAAAAAML